MLAGQLEISTSRRTPNAMTSLPLWFFWGEGSQMSTFTDWGKAVFLKPLPVLKLVEIDWGVHTYSRRKDTKPVQLVLPFKARIKR